MEITRDPQCNLHDIQLLVFDFDGIFTDNFVYVSQDGTESVRCSRGDSLGISLLKKQGKPECCILSTESNPVVSARASKLGITCIQGCGDKRKYLMEYSQNKDIAFDRIAFVGNDINDLDAMSVAGVSIAPADAYAPVREIADIVLKSPGGNGAVREVCELFLHH
jgi:N-acylneuraminate cytidylyltransferase